jgi:hypothetical protein
MIPIQNVTSHRGFRPLDLTRTGFRLTVAAIAMLVGLVESNFIAPKVIPLSYLEVRGSVFLVFLPIVSCCVGAFMATSKVGLERTQYGTTLRLVILIACCVLGYRVSLACVDRCVQFVQISGGPERAELTADEAERKLGFKIGLQIRPAGAFLFFRRDPLSAAKVDQWIHRGEASEPHLNR